MIGEDRHTGLKEVAETYLQLKEQLKKYKEHVDDLEKDIKELGIVLMSELDSLGFKQVVVDSEQGSVTITLVDNYVGSINDVKAFVDWAVDNGVDVKYNLTTKDTIDYRLVKHMEEQFNLLGINVGLAPVVHPSTLRARLNKNQGAIPGTWSKNERKIEVK